MHARGDGPFDLDVPLVRDRRVRKRWRYVGVFGPSLSLCAARVQVGPLTQEFWAVWDGQRLHERTRRRGGRVHVTDDRLRVRDGGTQVDLALGPAAPVEVVTPYGDAFAWTRKRAGGTARGSVVVDGVRHEVDGLAVLDDSAGFPPRRTSWLWSAGVGHAVSGEVVAWNTTTGLHDLAPHTESTVWVAGTPLAVPPGRISPSLTSVTWDAAGLAFQPAAVRRRSESFVVVRSSYEQPFGSFSGTLPGGIALASAHGVMERHDALW